MAQIKNSEISKYRTMYSVKQKYRCGICGASLASSMPTLDHCHDTGLLRGTLCNSCNRSEGKVKKAAQYMAKVTHLSKTDYIGWLRKLVTYLEKSITSPSIHIHPSFDTKLGKQKPVKRKRRTK